MGKVHRIKRSFSKAIARDLWEGVPPHTIKWYSLAGGVGIYAGVRYDGSKYIGYYGEPYNHLMRKLIRDFEAGVAPGDKSSITS